jgi:hypothetical protein
VAHVANDSHSHLQYYVAKQVVIIQLLEIAFQLQ